MPLYFAYGSNLNAAAMSRRCPSSRLIGPARLARHRFTITRDGYASVVRDPRREVRGLLYDLALADLPALDRYEGVAGGLYAKITQPVIAESGVRRALIYVGRGSEAGRPRPGYMEEVVAAARAAGFPDAYLRELSAFLPSRHTAQPADARPAVTPRFASPLARSPHRS